MVKLQYGEHMQSCRRLPFGRLEAAYLGGFFIYGRLAVCLWEIDMHMVEVSQNGVRAGNDSISRHLEAAGRRTATTQVQVHAERLRAEIDRAEDRRSVGVWCDGRKRRGVCLAVAGLIPRDMVSRALLG